MITNTSTTSAREGRRLHSPRRQRASWMALPLCALFLSGVPACASDAGTDTDDEAVLTATPSSTTSQSASSGSMTPLPANNPAPSPVATSSATSTTSATATNTVSQPVNPTPTPPLNPPVATPTVPSDEPSNPGPTGDGGAPPMGSGGTPAAGSGGTPEVEAGGAGTGGVGESGNGGATAEGGSAGEGPDLGETPCPTNGDPCKILPLGDSITDGFGTPGGYRIELFQHAEDAGLNITFVGNQTNGPDDGQFPRSHEGHSGWTVQQIDDIVPSPALNDEPHIILLHIGTNDIYQMPEGAGERLAELLDQLIEASPEALLVVSTIIPFPGMDATVEAYNEDVVDVVEERIGQGARLLFVDQFEGFPNEELDDGVHPNPAGYARMAGVWFDAIREYLR